MLLTVFCLVVTAGVDVETAGDNPPVVLDIRPDADHVVIPEEAVVDAGFDPAVDKSLLDAELVLWSNLPDSTVHDLTKMPSLENLQALRLDVSQKIKKLRPALCELQSEHEARVESDLGELQRMFVELDNVEISEEVKAVAQREIINVREKLLATKEERLMKLSFHGELLSSETLALIAYCSTVRVGGTLTDRLNEAARNGLKTIGELHAKSQAIMALLQSDAPYSFEIDPELVAAVPVLGFLTLSDSAKEAALRRLSEDLTPAVFVAIRVLHYLSEPRELCESMDTSWISADIEMIRNSNIGATIAVAAIENLMNPVSVSLWTLLSRFTDSKLALAYCSLVGQHGAFTDRVAADVAAARADPGIAREALLVTNLLSGKIPGKEDWELVTVTIPASGYKNPSPERVAEIMQRADADLSDDTIVRIANVDKYVEVVTMLDSLEQTLLADKQLVVEEIDAVPWYEDIRKRTQRSLNKFIAEYENYINLATLVHAIPRPLARVEHLALSLIQLCDDKETAAILNWASDILQPEMKNWLNLPNVRVDDEFVNDGSEEARWRVELQKLRLEVYQKLDDLSPALCETPDDHLARVSADISAFSTVFETELGEIGVPPSLKWFFTNQIRNLPIKLTASKQISVQEFLKSAKSAILLYCSLVYGAAGRSFRRRLEDSVTLVDAGSTEEGAALSLSLFKEAEVVMNLRDANSFDNLHDFAIRVPTWGFQPWTDNAVTMSVAKMEADLNILFLDTARVVKALSRLMYVSLPELCESEHETAKRMSRVSAMRRALFQIRADLVRIKEAPNAETIRSVTNAAERWLANLQKCDEPISLYAMQSKFPDPQMKLAVVYCTIVGNYGSFTNRVDQLIDASKFSVNLVKQHQLLQKLKRRDNLVLEDFPDVSVAGPGYALPSAERLAKIMQLVGSDLSAKTVEKISYLDRYVSLYKIMDKNLHTIKRQNVEKAEDIESVRTSAAAALDSFKRHLDEYNAVASRIGGSRTFSLSVVTLLVSELNCLCDVTVSTRKLNDLQPGLRAPSIKEMETFVSLANSLASIKAEFPQCPEGYARAFNTNLKEAWKLMNRFLTAFIDENRDKILQKLSPEAKTLLIALHPGKQLDPVFTSMIPKIRASFNSIDSANFLEEYSSAIQQLQDLLADLSARDEYLSPGHWPEFDAFLSMAACATTLEENIRHLVQDLKTLSQASVSVESRSLAHTTLKSVDELMKDLSTGELCKTERTFATHILEKLQEFATSVLKKVSPKIDEENKKAEKKNKSPGTRQNSQLDNGTTTKNTSFNWKKPGKLAGIVAVVLILLGGAAVAAHFLYSRTTK